MCRTVLVLLSCSAALAGADADLILHGGKIVTVDPDFSIRQAVASQAGKIIAVGDDKTVLGRRGAKTQVIDLRGATVLPGLIDSHVHALEAGLSEFRGPLPPLDSFAAVQSYIREQAAKTPKGQWIVVPRTFPTRLSEMRMPTRDVLDAGSKDYPVLFDASYVVIVNTLGLKISGITRETPNPPGGEIVKDAAGEPNGILKNAHGLVKGLTRRAAFSGTEKLRALQDMLKRYVAAGLTTVDDRAVDQEQIALYRELKSSGRLPVRVVLTWRPDASRPTEEVIAEVKGATYSTNEGDDWLKFGTFKLTLDGGMTIGTAYQRYPYGAFGRQLYAKTDSDDRGQLFIAPPKLLAIMQVARDRGWQLTTHDQGGAAIDNFLDCLEALDRKKPIAPTRSHVMHASFQSPEAIARMKKMGVLADVQAPWLYLDGQALERVFGNEGMRYFFPLRSYADAGILFASGTDHMVGFDKNRAVNPYNPFLGMWTEITRKTVRGSVLHAEEKISRREALKSYTIWSAYLQFSDKEKGSIEPGKLADLVVIDRDYLTCPEDEIRQIEPLMTIIDGKIVYRKMR